MQHLLAVHGEHRGDQRGALDGGDAGGVHQAEVAHVLAERAVGIGDEHFRARRDAAHRGAELAGRIRQLRPVVIDLDQPRGDQDDQHDHEGPPHQAAAQLQIAAGEQHEDDADRHALVGHVGVEHDARQREINRGADHEQREDQRMKAQHAVADRPHDAGDHDRHEREGGDVGIIADDIHQPVDLAALLPVGGADKLHGRAGIEQRRRGEERQAAGDEIDDAAPARVRSRRSHSRADLEREHADAVNAERREMAEEQREDASRRQREARGPGALAQRDPAGQRPQRDADAENVVHQSDQEDVIVEQRNGEQREHRPAADQRPVERQAAGNDEREHPDDEHLAGQIDVHDARQQRHDQVHGQVGDHLPVDLIEVGELRVLRQRRDHMHAGKVIDVVRQRRQRMRPDRDGNEQRERREQHADLRRREAMRAESRRRRIGR